MKYKIIDFKTKRGKKKLFFQFYNNSFYERYGVWLFI